MTTELEQMFSEWLSDSAQWVINKLCIGFLGETESEPESTQSSSSKKRHLSELRNTDTHMSSIESIDNNIGNMKGSTSNRDSSGYPKSKRKKFGS